jgi:hypothetical protein
MAAQASAVHVRGHAHVDWIQIAVCRRGSRGLIVAGLTSCLCANYVARLK